MEEKVYTPDEVAQIFQISKHTVYELIKRGELIAFKIGNKMRIEQQELDRFKEQQKAPVTKQSSIQNEAEGPSNPLRLAGSHDLLVEQLIKMVTQESNSVRIQPTYIGSLEGLMMLYRGQCDIAAIHLLDPSSQEYNLPFIHQLFVHEDISLIRLASREQGFIVGKGNPKKINTFHDLTRKDIRFVNRQKGSGTRFLFDSFLAKFEIAPQEVIGYEKEEWNHLSTASYISKGTADVTFGIQSAADQLGLDFIPIAKEQFDLVFKWTKGNRNALQQLLDILQDQNLQQELKHHVGYCLKQLGEIIYHSNLKET
ncbi:substrate-binding domain-containing protein [Neobacillus sp. D3-1R]|uniref:substrate-binding domain-containing protein n=1 Tax=Neobacillus sp. D3-1R TaxID=3445778 RepID=UPI003F9EFC38